MSKQVKKINVQKKMPLKEVAPKPFRVPYPALWLAAAVIILYFASLHFGYTELDDAIFIRDLHKYNEDLFNLVTSFHRGVFDAVKDTYYRPLFLDSIILNYNYLGGQNLVGYHVVNVLLHLISVLLLFNLFRKLCVKELHAFILSLLFAVHPVLSQAVAWIPGRNDTMLAVFTLSYLIFSIDYSNTGKLKWLLLATVFLLLSFFTKETAVFDAPVAFVLIVFLLQKNWRDKRNVIQYIAWFLVFVFWYYVRSTATLAKAGMAPAQMLRDFVWRLPVVVQYIGKIFLPFNLSVFPMMQDTVYYYGIAAIILLALAIGLAKEKNWRVILCGLAVFFLFLLPALVVPRELNEQTFEHRLYLPIIGILLILPQTILFKNNLKEERLLGYFVAAALVLGFINCKHQRSFIDPLSFWTQAVETSPHSAYANMMLGAREPDQEMANDLIRKAYILNPNEKYINYYYGVLLQKHDSILQSEKYFLAEKKNSDYYECDFYLARVAVEKKDLTSAQGYLERYLTHDPANPQANNNLLLIYLQTNQKAKAAAQAKRIQDLGQPVSPQILQQLK